MAITPKELIEMFENVQLSKNDQLKADKIIKNIDDQIIKNYASVYNKNLDGNPENGFECTVYFAFDFKNTKFEESHMAYSYILNSYKKSGWDIKIDYDHQWEMEFNLAALRDKNIEELLEEDDSIN
jgi:hypothetical protein